MSKSLNKSKNIRIRTHPSATIDYINDHLLPVLKRAPDKIIIHCGTNDLRGDKSPDVWTPSEGYQFVGV